MVEENSKQARPPAMSEFLVPYQWRSAYSGTAGTPAERMRCMVSTSTPVSYPFPWEPPMEIPEKWRNLREKSLLEVRLPTGDTALLVTRYHDIKALFADRRLSRNTIKEESARASESNDLFGDAEIDSDPPRYTEERGLVTRAFSARRVASLRPLTWDIANELLDKMEAGPRPAELKEAFAYPLPMRVICHLLGIPIEDESRFRHLVDGFLSLNQLPPEEVEQARTGLWNYISDLIVRKRAEPADDLTSELIQISDQDPARLSDYQLHNWLRNMLVAGYVTTADQIATSTAVLLHRPDVVADIRSDWSVIPSAVEELLRYQLMGSSIGSMRHALEDIELADGSVIPKGSSVMLSTEANVDENAFSDPLKLDIRRADNKHLTFGSGIHFCVGAALGRMELQIATEGLLRRFPGLRLAVPAAELPRAFGFFLGGFSEVPVDW